MVFYSVDTAAVLRLVTRNDHHCELCAALRTANFRSCFRVIYIVENTRFGASVGETLNSSISDHVVNEFVYVKGVYKRK